MHIISKSQFEIRFPNDIFYKLVAPLGLSPSGPFLAGGACRKLIAGQPFDSDWDFFFTNEEQLKDFQSKLQNVIEIKEGKTNNVVYVKKDDTTNYKFQLIKIYYPNISSLLDSFDFTLCQVGFDGENFYLADFAMKDILENKLVTNKITFPEASMRRTFKYTKQGYYMCAGSIAEFLKQIQTLQLGVEPKYID
jgi:hypothetical protein